MGFVPKGARWYLADLVVENTIEGDLRNVVHVNTHLIEAHSPEQAYQKANALGRAGDLEYTNTDGKRVRVVFRGLRELDVIHEDLADGAELFYKESVDVPESILERWVKPTPELSVFAARQDKLSGPNLMPEDIAKKLLEELTRQSLSTQSESS